MLIYDSISLAFIKKTEAMLSEIITEIGLPIKGKRFHLKNKTLPIIVVIFEGREWGHFNSDFLQIGLNRKLIYLAKDSVVRDILRHELAHYLTHILFPDAPSHGKEFHDVCETFKFPSQVSEAQMDLEKANLSMEGDLKAEQVLEKVKKLLSLAQSSNPHEAELATLKANDLLLRHHLEYTPPSDEKIYLERLLFCKRKDAKMIAIYSILEHFIVRTVISYGQNGCCLEVSGPLTNVKLAVYVVNFLEREFDHLWEIEKKDCGLRGMRAKNSFFMGLASGFNHRMKNLKKTYSPGDQQALVLSGQKILMQTEVIYPRLTSIRSRRSLDETAKVLGHLRGMNLSIRQAVEGAPSGLYLPHHSS